MLLYGVPVRDSVFSFTRTVLTLPSPFGSITSLNYDNVNETLFALNDTYDSTFTSTGRDIVEINKNTGIVTTRGQLDEFPSYIGGSASFDQNTGTFLLIGIDTNNVTKMIAFDTYTNTYIAGFVPNGVSEVVCDNSVFARNRYGTVGITEQQPALNFTMYPNPVSDVLSIEYASTAPATVQIFSALGELVWVKEFNTANRMDLDLSALSPGIYMVNLTSENQTASQKVVVR